MLIYVRIAYIRICQISWGWGGLGGGARYRGGVRAYRPQRPDLYGGVGEDVKVCSYIYMRV